MVNLIGFMIFTLLIAYRSKKNIVNVFPISLAFLLGVLFILAMIRHLSWIDYCSGAVSIIIMIQVIWMMRNGDFDFKRLKKILADPSFVAFLTAVLLIVFFEKDRIIYSWDELGCWALEVKTLFFADGFSLPGMHTTIGYAHYMPGQMLFGWWFCHLMPGQFHEGLMRVGYYIFFVAVLAPAFSFITPGKIFATVLKGLLLTAVLLILPSSVSIFEYGMLSVEFSQSALVGIMLYMIYTRSDAKKESNRYYWLACTYILIMLKDSSVIFLGFIYTLAFVLWRATRGKYGRPLKDLVLGGGLSVITICIWKTYVRLNARGIAYPNTHNFARLLLRFLQNPSGADEETLGYIRAFKDSIIQYPLHIERVWGLNFSVTGIVCFIVIMLYILYSRKIYDWGRKELLLTEVFAVGSIMIYLLVVLGMHMFYFRETQYLDAKTAMYSISRYMEPLFLGILVFLLLTCFLKMKRKDWIIAIFMIILFSDFATVWDCMIAYGPREENVIASKNKFLAERHGFFDAVNSRLGESGQGKILYVCNNVDEFNIRMFRYLSAPRAVIFLNCAQYDRQGFLDRLAMECREDNTDFIYFDHLEAAYIEGLNILNDRLYTRAEVTEAVFGGR